MTDEERLHMITEQLIIVRDNLFRGMSKSIQKLQAKSINEVLGLDDFTQSPKPVWVSLSNEQINDIKGRWVCGEFESFADCLAAIEAALRNKNT